MSELVHVRCPIPGIDVDVQQITENFLGNTPGSELIEDLHTWVEIVYDGNNPFITIPATSWCFVILYAKEDNLIVSQNPDLDVNIYILNPGMRLRAVIVSEMIRDMPGIKPGVSAAFRVRHYEKPKMKIWFGDSILPYGTA